MEEAHLHGFAEALGQHVHLGVGRRRRVGFARRSRRSRRGRCAARSCRGPNNTWRTERNRVNLHLTALQIHKVEKWKTNDGLAPAVHSQSPFFFSHCSIFLMKSSLNLVLSSSTLTLPSVKNVLVFQP